MRSRDGNVEVEMWGWRCGVRDIGMGRWGERSWGGDVG